MNIEKIKEYTCPVEAAMDVIGGKYKAQIVYELLDGTKRYHEIQRVLPQATPRMLSKQLKEWPAGRTDAISRADYERVQDPGSGLF